MFECLKKAGRIANQCMEEGVKAQLLVELLSIYMHFYEKGNDQVSWVQRSNRPLRHPSSPLPLSLSPSSPLTLSILFSRSLPVC
ncbi:MAG: vacuolar protein sorting-associated protein 35 [Proteobacteria bacterium]|nr:vacuolar protein sorting-associated protein 35 [Pseudomonadota bacterium]